MEALLKKLTSEKTVSFWGVLHTGSDYLVEAIHGDGLKLVWFQTMDSRPFSYYIRVDSSLDLNLEDQDILSEDDREHFGKFSEMLMQMIEEECNNIDRYYELPSGLHTCKQDEAEGIEPFSFDFPMLSTGNGYYYNEIET